MKQFEFSNEQIVFLFKHFSDYCESLNNTINKQIQFTAGQLELLEKTYGDKEDFNKEAHALHTQLMTVEMPALLKTRAAFIEQIRDKFSEVYSLLANAAPEVVEEVENKLFSEPENIKDLVKQIENLEKNG